jgi:hypothetical protein
MVTGMPIARRRLLDAAGVRCTSGSLAAVVCGNLLWLAAVFPAVIGETKSRGLLLDAPGVRCTLPASLAAVGTLKRPDPHALLGHGAGVAFIYKCYTGYATRSSYMNFVEKSWEAERTCVLLRDPCILLQNIPSAGNAVVDTT